MRPADKIFNLDSCTTTYMVANVLRNCNLNTY